MAADDDDDLGRLLEGLRRTVGGLEQVARAVPGAAARVGGAAGHLTDPKTLDRIVDGALAGAFGVAAQEVASAAATERAHPGEHDTPAGAGTRTLACDEHGRLPWEGTICCAVCRRVFQVRDKTRPLYAPERCPCTVRLMPPEMPSGQAPDPRSYSAVPLCGRCFQDALRTGGIARRRPAS